MLIFSCRHILLNSRIAIIHLAVLGGAVRRASQSLIPSPKVAVCLHFARNLFLYPIDNYPEVYHTDKHRLAQPVVSQRGLG